MARVLAFLFALLLAPAALAGSEAPRHDARCPELARISLYASILGGFERLDVCPEIIFSASHPLAIGPRQDRVAGPNRGTAFFPETGAIQLSAQIDTQTVAGMAQLLHAMVHVYQYAHGLDAAAGCRRTLERQALEIQARFLHDNGLEKEARHIRSLAELNTPCGEMREALR